MPCSSIDVSVASGPRRQALRRRRILGLAVAPLLVIGGCRKGASSEITVHVEDGKSQKTRFSARSAFAEYFALPGDRHELRIFLASYQSSCEEYVAPGESETLVTLVLFSPAEQPPGPGAYPVLETPKPESSIETAFAVPKAHLDEKAYLFQPGGTVRLSQVDLVDHGVVAGLVDARFAGDADHPASTLEGSFTARICRFHPAPER